MFHYGRYVNPWTETNTVDNKKNELSRHTVFPHSLMYLQIKLMETGDMFTHYTTINTSYLMHVYKHGMI